MQSTAVRDGILRFYDRFSAGDPARFAEVIANVEGVSVIGTGPSEGHDDRTDWISTYDQMMKGEASGMRLEGGEPRAYAEGSFGWAVDEPQFVLPDGSRLPTRLTAVLRQENGDWKIVHLHFSVGVPDEQAMALAKASDS